MAENDLMLVALQIMRSAETGSQTREHQQYDNSSGQKNTKIINDSDPVTVLAGDLILRKNDSMQGIKLLYKSTSKEQASPVGLAAEVKKTHGKPEEKRTNGMASNATQAAERKQSAWKNQNQSFVERSEFQGYCARVGWYDD
ncbi:hypothetical protein R1sor_025748 [Riccia sorocarpa]|uniref:Uncharacterized protein n=1 Tax=Riccia sorocarpa TaxID=122646 RepID=A0ABD3GCI7_9MARC